VHSPLHRSTGLIYSTGTSTAKVRVWDMKSLGNVATFDGHTGPVRSLAFSENGFYMASASDDHTGKAKILTTTTNTSPHHRTHTD
jgi:pre-mRNA-processing factor 19